VTNRFCCAMHPSECDNVTIEFGAYDGGGGVMMITRDLESD
jgi:hypothetical protein